MLKIQRSANGQVVFKLSGRIEAEDIKLLREVLALETTGKQLVLDLRDVTLVNQDAVKFLSSCAADSIKLKNCPAYIREWIEQARVVPDTGERNENDRISARVGNCRQKWLSSPIEWTCPIR
jgi:hypothetical protein